jgi:sec-independent protein translocase protein TatC
MAIPADVFGARGRARPSRPWRHHLIEWGAALAVASQEMSFLEHLDELRRRLIWSVASLAVAFGICCFFYETLYDLASAPIRMQGIATLTIARPQDIVGLYFQVILVGAIFLSAPFVLVQAWLFISPGLHPHERRYAIPFVLSATLLFVTGGVFGYFVAFPAALRFLLDWIVASHLTPMIDIGEYFNLFFTVMVALGIVFQIPAVMFVLSRIGLVDAPFLLRHAKYAVLGSVIVAAIVTPTSDPWNMLLIAGPMIVLYGVGIVIAWVFGRRRTSVSLPV